MNNKRVLIVGCGDIGIPLAQQLQKRGARVWGLRRNPGCLPPSIHPIAADITRPESLSPLADIAFDYVVTTLTPAGFSEQGYRQVFVDGVHNLLQALCSQPSLQRIFHVSSTSVYHQSGGEWVDENSPTMPTSFSGRLLQQSEQQVCNSRWPATVVRFAGIYGPGRRRLIEQVASGQGCPQQPALYTNRIHRDDCVGVLLHLLQMACDGVDIDTLYLGVDNEPVTMWQVKHWLAQQLGVTLDDTAPSTSMRRSSKRCSNQRLLSTGYQFRYPSYRDGYAELVRQC